MAIVRTDIPITSEANEQYIKALVSTYPFLRTEVLTTTAFQRPISTLVAGGGPRKVIFSASHHANEWITSLVLLQFAEELAEAIQAGKEFYGKNAKDLAEQVTIYMVPMVDPDGVDLVVGSIEPGDIQYDLAERLAKDYPTIPFPEGWKANLPFPDDVVGEHRFPVQNEAAALLEVAELTVRHAHLSADDALDEPSVVLGRYGIGQRAHDFVNSFACIISSFGRAVQGRMRENA